MLRARPLLSSLLLVVAVTGCRKEVPSLDEGEEPAATCAPLDDAARAELAAVVHEAYEVVFSHDVATYCRVYSADSVEESGRSALADDHDVSVPFDTNVRYHALREGTRTRTQPTWSVAIGGIDGDRCAARVEGTADFAFGSGGELLGFDAAAVRRDGRWVLLRHRSWPIAERDAEGKEVRFDADRWRALDADVERALASGALGWPLVDALFAAYRMREAYDVVVAASDAAPDDFGLLLQRSVLASSVGRLEDLVEVFRRLRVLSEHGGPELPQHVAQTLANLDAGGTFTFTGCPALPAPPADDAKP